MITLATRRPKVPRAHVLDGGKPAPRSTASSSVREGSPRPAPRDAQVTDLAEKAKAKSGSAGGGTKHAAPSAPSSSAGPKGAARKGGATKGGGKNGAAGTRTSDGGKEAAVPEAAPVPARAFSGRLLALGVVMVAIVIVLAPTVKNWWEQRQQISQLQADIRSRQNEQDGLKKEISRWHDPAYVQQQARDRINMVMPGETGYWVFGKDGGTAGVPSGPADGGTTPAGQSVPWTQKFLDSVRESTK